VSDIGMIFLTNVAPMTQDKVRQALAMAIDKKGPAERLLKGHVTSIDTLQARSYAAFDSSIKALRPQARRGPDGRGRLHARADRGDSAARPRSGLADPAGLNWSA
jgi:ABC-type transport system substrate-binding protein